MVKLPSRLGKVPAIISRMSVHQAEGMLGRDALKWSAVPVCHENSRADHGQHLNNVQTAAGHEPKHEAATTKVGDVVLPR